jgi:hypothetical protein
LNKALKWIAAVIFIFALAGCSVAESPSRVPPKIELFTVNPPAVSADQSALLTWVVSDNTSMVNIEPGIGPVLASGSVAVTPGHKQDYTIEATNSYGTVTASVTVGLIKAEPQQTQLLPTINSFSASPEHGYAGTMFEISWNVEDADTITLQWGDKNSLEFTRNVDSTVQQPVITTTYILLAKNKQGVRAVNLTVTIDRDLQSTGGGNSPPSCG